MKKIAFIARSDNSGLGILSWEFIRHIKPWKVIIVENGVYKVFRERYVPYCDQRMFRKRNFSREDAEWLLEGTDVLFLVETPYQDWLPQLAKRMKVKVVMMPMYESFSEKDARPYDLILCPSLLDYQVCREPKKFMPFPVARDRLPFKLKEKAKVFVHNAGHGGMASRNGTEELVKAMEYVKSDIKLIIHSQTDMPGVRPDSRMEIRIGNVENYWDIWEEGDVFVFPEKFNGLSLPINEALSLGMAVMSSNRFPFNDYLPKSLLINVRETMKVRIANRLIDYAIINPKDVAEKIDEWAGRDITPFSKKSDELAEEISWNKLEHEYLKIFNEL